MHSEDLQKLAEEHAAQIALLRKLYRFSETEANDFLEGFGDAPRAVDSAVDSFPVEHAA